MKVFKSNMMKAATFFAVTCTVSPLFAGQVKVYVDATGEHDPNIKSLYFRIPKKYGAEEVIFWKKSKGSLQKTTLTVDNKGPFLYFFWKNASNQTAPLPDLAPLENGGRPLRSLKITLGAEEPISNLKYEGDEEDAEVGKEYLNTEVSTEEI